MDQILRQSEKQSYVKDEYAPKLPHNILKRYGSNLTTGSYILSGNSQFETNVREVRSKEINKIPTSEPDSLLDQLRIYLTEEEAKIPFTDDNGKIVNLEEQITTLETIFNNKELPENKKINITEAIGLKKWIEKYLVKRKAKEAEELLLDNKLLPIEQIEKALLNLNAAGYVIKEKDDNKHLPGKQLALIKFCVKNGYSSDEKLKAITNVKFNLRDKTKLFIASIEKSFLAVIDPDIINQRIANLINRQIGIFGMQATQIKKILKDLFALCSAKHLEKTNAKKETRKSKIQLILQNIHNPQLKEYMTKFTEQIDKLYQT